MEEVAHHLVGWKLFCTKSRDNGSLLCDTTARRKLNRFYARYRLAVRFDSLRASGYSEKALRGYTAGLRLLVSYSAAELLGEAIGIKIITWKMPNPALAAVLRQILTRSFADSDEIFSSKDLQNRVQLFMDGDDDVRVPATALRVMVAHGSFTPTGTDSLKKAGADALQQLSELLLQECEQRFRDWLRERLASVGESPDDSLKP